MGRWKNRLMGAAIAVLGLFVLVLAYNFVTRVTLLPDQEDGTAQEIIQVEVRNGCGIGGLAGVMTLFLREHGYDVVEVGDYESFNVARSMVIDRVGNLETARKVAEELGIRQVEQDIRPEYFLDASVVIGLDYETLRPFKE